MIGHTMGNRLRKPTLFSITFFDEKVYLRNHYRSLLLYKRLHLGLTTAAT